MGSFATVNYFILIVGIGVFLCISPSISNQFNFSPFKSYALASFSFVLISAALFLCGIGSLEFLLFNIRQTGLLATNTFLFGYILITTFRNSKADDISRCLVVFLICSFALYISQLFSNDFRLFYIDNFTSLDELWLGFAQTNFRGIGWQGLSIWDTSLSYALISLCLYPLLSSNRLYDHVLWIIGAMILLFLVSVSGRTGLFLFLIFLVIQIYFSKKWSMGLILIGLSILLLLVATTFIGNDIEPVFRFMFEIFDNISNGNGFKTESTDDLLDNHIYFPEVNNFLFGDGYYINDLKSSELFSSKNRPSDSTFVINYVSSGLIGVFLTCVMIFINYKILICSLQRILMVEFKGLIVHFVLFIMVALIYVKAPPYYSQSYLKALMFVWIFGLLITKRSQSIARIEGANNMVTKYSL